MIQKIEQYTDYPHQTIATSIRNAITYYSRDYDEVRVTHLQAWVIGMTATAVVVFSMKERKR